MIIAKVNHFKNMKKLISVEFTELSEGKVTYICNKICNHIKKQKSDIYECYVSSTGFASGLNIRNDFLSIDGLNIYISYVVD